MALTDNLLSYWKFDESSGNAADSTANAKTLTNVNTATYASAKINNGANLVRASAQKFTQANTSGYYDPTSGTINAWVKISALPGTPFALYIAADALNNTTKGQYFGVDQTVKVFGGFGAGAQQIGGTTVLSSNDTTFYMLTFTWSTAGKELFVNGVSEASSAVAETITTSTNEFWVGDNPSNVGQYWNGKIDEVGFWSRVLTGAEITELYNSGAGLTYPFTTATSGKNFLALTLLGVG